MPIANRESDAIANLRGLRALWVDGSPFPSGPVVDDAEASARVLRSKPYTSIPVHTAAVHLCIQIPETGLLKPKIGKEVKNGAGRVLAGHPLDLENSRRPSLTELSGTEPQTMVGVLRGPDSFLFYHGNH